MDNCSNWLGLDIGGANLKAATASGYASHTPFALWRHPQGLAAAIAKLAEQAPPHAGWAVTMTGELADCFQSKAEGVAAIAAAVVRASDAGRVGFYSAADSHHAWLSATQACEHWGAVAAFNWHALATTVARQAAPDAGILIDVGSTTTDVVPFRGGQPAAAGTDDASRMAAGELVYLGVARTPLCAVVHTLPYRGTDWPVARELFATTADAAVLAGQSGEATAAGADGRPMEYPNAVVRMARMLCRDTTTFTDRDAVAAAQYVCTRLEQQVALAVQAVLGRNPDARRFVVAGEGAWLARAALARLAIRQGVESLSDLIGPHGSRCGPAWAVACLADAGPPP